MARKLPRFAVSILLAAAIGATLPAAAAASDGAIAGTVRDASSHTVGHVEVDVFDLGGDVSDSTCTAPDGTYTVSGLPPGSYRVAFLANSRYSFPFGPFTATGQCGSQNYLNAFDGASPDFTHAPWVSVASGATTSGVDSSLATAGSITGTVDNTSAVGVANVEVDLSAAPGVVESTCTASDGSYSLTGLPTGYYRVQFLPNGQSCSATSSYSSQYYGTTDLAADGTPVGVTAGSATSGIDATLQPAGTLEGTVTSAGSPLAHALVEAYPTQEFTSVVQPSFTACTAADGTYSITGLPPGSYQIGFYAAASASPCGGSADLAPRYYNGAAEGTAQLSQASAVSVANGPVSGIDAALDAAGGQIGGTVTDSLGQPAANVAVSIDAAGHAPGPWSEYGVCTGSDGSYTIGGLPPGSYTVSFDSSAFQAPFCGATSQILGASYYDGVPAGTTNPNEASPVTVGAGTSVGGVDMLLGSAPTGDIAGTVTNQAHQPVAGVSVSVSGPDGAGGATCTGPDGSYDVNGLPPEQYTVQFSIQQGACAASNGNYAPQFYDGSAGGAATFSAALGVSVSSGQTSSGIDAALATGAQISGTVTNGSHAPVANVEVQLTSGPSTGAIACTASDGTYTISDLAAGVYQVEFVATGEEPSLPFGAGGFPDACGPDGSYADQFYSGAATSSAATTITLSGGESQGGVDATLAGAGSISGTVSDQSMNSLANVSVAVSNAGGTWVTTVCTAADGAYTVGNLPAGNYDVEFDPTSTTYCLGAGSDYFPQYYADQPTITAATPVTVSAGSDTSGVDATIATAGEIAGTVTSTAADPLANVEVDVYNASGTAIAETCTTADGTYAVAGLSSEKYTVGFETTGFPFGGCAAIEPLDYLPQFNGGASSDATATPIDVVAGATTAGIDATLSPSGAIAGVVTDQNNGNGISDIGVRAFDSSSDKLVGETCTDVGGGYRLDGLPTASYAIQFGSGPCFGPNASDYVPDYYSGQSSFASANNVAVTDGSTATANESLTPAGQISGTVIDAETGLPARVAVDVTDGHGEIGGCTNTNGQYQFGGLEPGSYTVEFAPSGASCGGTTSFVTQYYDGAATQAGADSVTVTGGLTTIDVNAALTESPVAGVVPSNASAPAISGSALAGSTLTETHGAWSNNPTSYTYQWEDCAAGGGTPCAPIPGATAQTYELQPSDAGHSLIVLETGHNAYGPSVPAPSSPTAPVPSPPANTAPPTIAGGTVVGDTLTESHGSWSETPLSYAYTWEDCNAAGSGCVAIANATQQTYVLTQSDIGRRIVAEETATGVGGTSGPATSAPTAIVSGTSATGPAATSSSTSPGSSPASSTAPSAQSQPAVAGTADVRGVTVTGSTVSVTIHCVGGTPCAVALSLTAVETLHAAKGSPKVGRKHASTRTITVGSTTTTVAAGATETIRVSLNGSGASILARLHALNAMLTATQLVAAGHTILIHQPVALRGQHRRK